MLTTKKRSVLFLSFLLFCAFSLISCREEYDLKPLTEEPQLVIDGQITNEYRRHTVRLRQSGGYLAKGDYPPVSGAVVYIKEKEQSILLHETEAGVYQTDSLAGRPETLYTLHIDWNGQIYTATDSMGAVPLPFEPTPFINEEGRRVFEYRRHQFGFPEAHQWRLVLEPKDSSQFSKIDVSELGQQIGVNVTSPGTYRFTYYTHPNIEVNGLMNFEEAHFYAYRPGRKATQIRYHLSKNYYAFLRSLFMETEWRGSLFASTPANIKGNISQDGLGYFSACAVRKISFTLD